MKWVHSKGWVSVTSEIQSVEFEDGLLPLSQAQSSKDDSSCPIDNNRCSNYLTVEPGRHKELINNGAVNPGLSSTVPQQY